MGFYGLVGWPVMKRKLIKGAHIPIGSIFMDMRMPRTPMVRLVVHNEHLGRTPEPWGW